MDEAMRHPVLDGLPVLIGDMLEIEVEPSDRRYCRVRSVISWGSEADLWSVDTDDGNRYTNRQIVGRVLAEEDVLRQVAWWVQRPHRSGILVSREERTSFVHHYKGEVGPADGERVYIVREEM